MSKLDLIMCDQCGKKTDVDDWNGVTEIAGDTEPEEFHFCCYECVRDWAIEMIEAQKPGGFEDIFNRFVKKNEGGKPAERN